MRRVIPSPPRAWPEQSLKPNPRYAHAFARPDPKIIHSIRTLGINCPIIVDDEENVLAGNAVLKAAKSIGVTEVPTVCLSHMTEAEKRGFVVATIASLRRPVTSCSSPCRAIDPPFSSGRRSAPCRVSRLRAAKP